MSVPVRLLAVDGQMDTDAVLLAPRIEDLLIIDQILLGTRAIDDVDLAVAAAVVAAVIDDRVQRSKADAARDEQQILSRKCSGSRPLLLGAANGDLLARPCCEPVRHAAAFLMQNLDIIRPVGWR